MRPLSGSASTGLFTERVQRLGPDSLTVRMAGIIFGSTETTFHVIAVHFRSVGIRRMRHAMAAGLFAGFFGVVASIAVCRMLFGQARASAASKICCSESSTRLAAAASGM